MDKKSFQKNLHILVEKSLACEYEEVVELNNLAKEKFSSYRKFFSLDFILN